MTHSDGHGGEARQPGLAPVTYLPGATPPREAPRRAAGLDAAPRRPVTFSDEYWAADEEEAASASIGAEEDSGVRDDRTHDVEPEPLDRETVIEQATARLARSLGSRGLSIAEARAKLRTAGLADDETSVAVEDFIARGWLDDALLAEQLVHSATTRKDMGTRAVRQLLVKRLVAREVVDAVIAELPDDDAERALEFARSKARGLSRYDEQTATRRLLGQLARRGFGGSSASQAVRTALAEERGAGGVRFR